MNTSWMDDTDVAEYDGGMGSWLSSFLKCGKTKCVNLQQQAIDSQTVTTNLALEGQVATAAMTKLQAQCKMPNPVSAAAASAKKILTASNAYAAVQTDVASANTIVSLVVADLLASNQVQIIPGCEVTAPVITSPIVTGTPQVSSILSSVSPDLLIIGGLGLVAVMLLKD